MIDLVGWAVLSALAVAIVLFFSFVNKVERISKALIEKIEREGDE